MYKTQLKPIFIQNQFILHVLQRSSSLLSWSVKLRTSLQWLGSSHFVILILFPA